jgi:hypothetical protein
MVDGVILMDTKGMPTVVNKAGRETLKCLDIKKAAKNKTNIALAAFCEFNLCKILGSMGPRIMTNFQLPITNSQTNV